MPQFHSTVYREEAILVMLGRMPLASVRNLTDLLEFTTSQCRKTLDKLQAVGDVACQKMGATEKLQRRYWLTGQGARRLAEAGEDLGWYVPQPGGKALAQRLTMVEQVYGCLPRLLISPASGILWTGMGCVLSLA